MNLAIILVAGVGSRMQSELPKQFIKINNKPLFIYTLEQFNIKEIDQIILVINTDYKDEYLKYIQDFPKEIKLISGGSTRQQSIDNALNSLKCNDNDIILIHDGARPLIDKKIIVDNINMCKKMQTPIITVINIVDTITDKDYNLLDRTKLMSVQTPQTFMFNQIKFLHDEAKKHNITNASDDGQLAKKFNLKINYVNGSRLNFKITDKTDLELFSLLKEGEK